MESDFYSSECAERIGHHCAWEFLGPSFSLPDFCISTSKSNVVSCIPVFEPHNHTRTMFRNYVFVAIRLLKKHSGYSFINVFGLGLGIAAASLIFLFARSELTVDHFHEKGDRIYLAYKERVTPTGTQATYDTWVPLLERMQSSLPSIETGTRTFSRTSWVQYENRKFEDEVTYADPELFDVFTFPLERGTRTGPLADIGSAVISSEMADKYFGTSDPIGKVITIDYLSDYTVSAVLAPIPENATLRPDILVQIQSMSSFADNEDNWGGSFLETYLLLDENASVSSLEALFPQLVTEIWDAGVSARTNFKLLPLFDAYDTFTGSRQYAFILLAIAMATILIASINFVNLTTARSLERAGEVGMRKVLGAKQSNLVGQFLGESVLLGMGALVFGLMLAKLLLPWFNDVYGLNLTLNLFGDPAALLAAIGFGLAIGLLSGIYPAIFLSRFGLVGSLKGALKSSSHGLRIRQGLVVVQFSMSIVLIAGTFIMIDQVKFMKNQDLSFDKENVLVIPIEQDDFADQEEATMRIETFKNDLMQKSGIVSVSSSSHVPGRWGGWFTFARPEGSDPENPMRVRLSFMDASYFNTYGINFVEGRSFIEGSELDRDHSVVINEAARREFGWDRAENKTIRTGGTDFEVIGVVNDYHFASLVDEIAPILHFYRPPENGVHGFLSVRYENREPAWLLGSMEASWAKLDPTRTFEPFFANDNFDLLYQTQDRLSAVAVSFSILAILIACLGLFGLASLTVIQRTKEIGVRKVLGASVTSIAAMISKDFAKLVLIALVVATPVVFLTLNPWLAEFAYRIDIGIGTILLSGAIALFIALATVSIQSIRAGLSDPVECIRYE